MNISNNHPMKIDLSGELGAIRSRVKDYESKLDEGDDQYSLLLGLKDLRDRIYDFQIQRFGFYFGCDSSLEDLSDPDKKTAAEVLDLQKRIDHMMQSV